MEQKTKTLIEQVLILLLLVCIIVLCWQTVAVQKKYNELSFDYDKLKGENQNCIRNQRSDWAVDIDDYKKENLSDTLNKLVVR